MSRKLREVLPAAFPEDTFYFQAADIVTQILNFGLPAQIDVRTVGYDAEQSRGCQGAAAAARRHSRHRRRASAAGGRRAGVLRRDRPHPGRPARPQRQHGRHQHQCQPEFLGAGVAEFLDRSDLGDSLLSRRADAGIPDQLAECARQHAGVDVAGGQRRPGAVPGHAQQCRDVQARHRADQLQPDQHPAGLRRLCQRAGPRSRRRVAADINKVTADLQKQLKPGNTSR